MKSLLIIRLIVSFSTRRFTNSCVHYSRCSKIFILNVKKFSGHFFAWCWTKVTFGCGYFFWGLLAFVSFMAIFTAGIFICHKSRHNFPWDRKVRKQSQCQLLEQNQVKLSNRLLHHFLDKFQRLIVELVGVHNMFPLFNDSFERTKDVTTFPTKTFTNPNKKKCQKLHYGQEKNSGM